MLMGGFYGGLVGLYSEEVELATDFVSLLVDEEAIGNVALGDGLLWINGVEDVERTYKTYEYDDNFEYREVEKTKTEKLPDFTLLFSSKDQKIFHKLLSYGQYKGKIVKEEPHVFRLKDRNSPMDIFITMCKGMIAMGSSKTDIQHIAMGKKIGNASKKQKQLIRKNKFTFLVNSAQSKEILWKESALNKQNEALNTFIQQVSDVQMTSEGIKDNSLVGEISMDVPYGSSNGLTYLLDLIGSIATTM